MIFLSLLAVLAIMHWTSAASHFQRDGWFIWLLNRFRALPATASVPLLPMLLSLVVPLFVLILCVGAIVYFLSPAFLFFLYVPVLLFSLGRGDFYQEVNTYIDAANRSDSVAARTWIDDMAGHADPETHIQIIDDWKGMHTQALRVISYRSFERTFAVIFWFVIAGAVGALLYRLSSIYRDQTSAGTAEAQLADKWLWLIEMPAVRLMGLTWAFVGNFDSCPWRDSLLDTESSSIAILNNSLRGALSAPTDAYIKKPVVDVADASETPTAVVSEEILEEEILDKKALSELAEATQQAEENAQEVIEDLVGITLSPNAEPAYSFALVKSSVPLYSRSLLFCVGVIAFATLFI